MAKSTDSQTQLDGPLLIGGPKAAAESAGSTAAIIDLEPLGTGAADQGAASPEAAAAEASASESASRWRLPAHAPLAASIALAAAVGALAGAGATAALMRDETPTVDATRALQDSVAQLGSDLATLKAGIASAQRSTSTQFGKLTERLERSEKAQEKAQADPAGRLAKLQESIDRLEHSQQLAATPPAPAAAPEVTGSITLPKDESKPQVAEGWRLRDFYDGRAVVESRNGTLFRVGPGSNVPGLGKVEAIKRENGKVVVVTAAGTIAAALEPRRPPYYYRW